MCVGIINAAAGWFELYCTALAYQVWDNAIYRGYSNSKAYSIYQTLYYKLGNCLSL